MRLSARRVLRDSAGCPCVSLQRPTRYGRDNLSFRLGRFVSVYASGQTRTMVFVSVFEEAEP